MRILIVKLSALGDVVQTFDTLSYLRHRFPTATIDWLVSDKFAPLARRHPALSNLFKRNSAPYDILFDLQGNIKSAIASLQARAKRRVGFAYKDVSEWPNILFTNERYPLPPHQNIRNDYLYLAKCALNDNTPYTPTAHPLITTAEEDEKARALASTSRILVAPGSRWKNKQLRPGSIDPKGKLFLTGNAEERKLAESFGAETILPPLPFGELIALFKQMELVFSADSFPLHLAGALGIPTEAHFGPSSALKYAPRNCKATQGHCPYGQTFEKRCKNLRTCITGACMNDEVTYPKRESQD